MTSPVPVPQRLLIHPCGESDVNLPSTRSARPMDPPLGNADRGAKLAARMDDLRDLERDGEDERLVAELLGAGPQDPEAPPLRKILTALGVDRAPSQIVLVVVRANDASGAPAAVPAGRKEPSGPALVEIATVLQRLWPRVLRAAGWPRQPEIAVVVADAMSEDRIIQALHDAPIDLSGDVVVSLGSGATGISLGAMSAVLLAGGHGSFVEYGKETPGGRVTQVAPVARALPMLMRWRQFDTVRDLNGTELHLTAGQARAVAELADRRDRAHAFGADQQDMAALILDAVVRRDGTAGLAARRYNIIEFGPNERKWPKGGLAGTLRELGKASSHELSPPTFEQAEGILRHLTDKKGRDLCREVGLPEPGMAPATRILALVVGAPKSRRPEDRRAPVQTLLDAWERYPEVRRHIVGHTEETALKLDCVTFATPEALATLPPFSEKDDTSDGEGKGGVTHHVVATPGLSEGAALGEVVAAEVRQRVDDGTAAVLVLTTGAKEVLARLLDAARHAAADRGVPLWLLENPPRGSKEGQEHRRWRVHLWPSAIGDARPLLLAAKAALQRLELDVAARLLAAVPAPPGRAHSVTLSERLQDLADDFACRHDTARRVPTGGAESGLPLLGDRLALVAHVDSPEQPAGERFRHIVLAGVAYEISVAAGETDELKRIEMKENFRKELDCAENGVHDRVIRSIARARNRTPIAHGKESDAADPDECVRSVCSNLGVSCESLTDWFAALAVATRATSRSTASARTFVQSYTALHAEIDALIAATPRPDPSAAVTSVIP